MRPKADFLGFVSVAAPPFFEGQFASQALEGPITRVLHAVVPEFIHFAEALATNLAFHYLIKSVRIKVDQLVLYN